MFVNTTVLEKYIHIHKCKPIRYLKQKPVDSPYCYHDGRIFVEFVADGEKSRMTCLVQQSKPGTDYISYLIKMWPSVCFILWSSFHMIMLFPSDLPHHWRCFSQGRCGKNYEFSHQPFRKTWHFGKYCSCNPYVNL